MPEGFDEMLTGKRAAALERTLDLLVKLDEMGVLEVVDEVLDPDVIGYLARLLMHPGLLRAADRLDLVFEALGKLDIEAATSQVELVNKALKAVPEEAEPVGLLGLLGALGDPDVQRGLGFLVEFLRNLGRALAEKEK